MLTLLLKSFFLSAAGICFFIAYIFFCGYRNGKKFIGYKKAFTDKVALKALATLWLCLAVMIGFGIYLSGKA